MRFTITRSWADVLAHVQSMVTLLAHRLDQLLGDRRSVSSPSTFTALSLVSSAS
jgi:hypothetical protein